MEIGWLKKAVGEISKLRKAFSVAVAAGKRYQLDSSQVKPDVARNLYNNTEDSYKLGAGFCRRVINSKWGFMGIPSFLSEDPEAELALKRFFENNTAKMGQVHKKALIEGKTIVWITREEEINPLYPESDSRLVFNIIPNEELDYIVRDPLTRQPIKYHFSYTYVWYDDQGREKKTKIKHTISAEKRTFKQEGDQIPNFVTEQTNPWGFIPIVIFRNEADETMEDGQSDLEPIEPFLKAYHDLLFNALQGSHMHATPKLKLKLKDISKFLLYNFGITNAKEAAEKGEKISFDGKEVLFFEDGDEAGFIEISSPSSGIDTLLKFLFYCIVDASETPEFMFGVHTPAALASTKEQMPTFIRTITRKRDNFTDPWQMVARIVLAMIGQAGGKKFSTYATTLQWAEVDPRDEKEFALTLDSIAKALKTAIDGKFLSREAAAEFLRKYIPTMETYQSEDKEVETELKRIFEDQVIDARLEDGATNLKELEEMKKSA